MKLNVLIEQIKKKTNEENPEIFICGNGGFLEIVEVNHRSDYYDEHPAFGCPFKSGDFIVLETK